MVSTDGQGVVEEQEVETTPVPDVAEPTPEQPQRRKRRSPRARRRRIDRALIDFQPDAVEIEERPIPGRARWTLYIIILIIVSVVAWAWLTEVDRVVVAEGQLVTTVSPIIVASATTNEVREVRAKFGQRVVAGEILAVLDGDLPEIDVEKLQKDILARRATIARLIAERDHLPFEVNEQESNSIALLDELSLYRSRQEERKAKVQELTQAIKKIEAEIKTNETNRRNNDEKLAVLAELEAVIEDLKIREIESQFEYLQARLRTLEAEGRVLDLESKKEELQEQLVQAQETLTGYEANWDARVNEELVKAQNELQQVLSDLEKAEKQTTFINLIVPAEPADQEYMVLEATDRASVAEGAQPLFKLMPIDVPLEAEVEIAAKDIGRITLDDDVRIKLTAFPYQKHGTLTGTVRTISEGSFQKGEGPMETTFFRSNVSLLDGQQLDNVQPDMRLMPGMSATCEIKVGKRRVIDYFLYPLFRQLDESIREP